MTALTSIAVEIRREHEAASTAARSALQHARRAGELLTQAKTALRHGAWLPWLTEHCPDISERTAQAYMRVAARWPELEAKAQRVADLPVRQALALLAEPREADSDTAAPTSPDDWKARLDASREDFDRAIRRHMENERDFARWWFDDGGSTAEAHTPVAPDVAELRALGRAVDAPGVTIEELVAISDRADQIFAAAFEQRTKALAGIGDLFQKLRRELGDEIADALIPLLTTCPSAVREAAEARLTELQGRET
jgi:hypothetical protein